MEQQTVKVYLENDFEITQILAKYNWFILLLEKVILEGCHIPKAVLKKRNRCHYTKK